MLRPLQSEESISISEQRRTCEACGRSGLSPYMINVIMVVGSPGHPLLPPFQCSQEEHWACSTDCWLKVAHACIDEHMIVLLKNCRGEVGT